MFKKIFLAILSAPIFYFFSFAMARAAASSPAVIDTNLPGPYSVSSTGPVAIVGNIYYFALGIGGLLAFGSIVYAGIKWAASQGNPSSISDAKDQITQAALGLVMLMGAYIILNTINPQLTILEIPKLTAVKEAAEGAPPAGPTSTSTCPIGPLITGDDPKFSETYGVQAAAMESGQAPKVLFSSSDANVQKNLTKLQAEWGKFQNLAGQPGSGFAVTANSAYRPLGYQKHLYDIYVLHKKFSALTTPEAIQACANLKSKLTAEEQKHGICSGSTCLVGSPNSCAKHVIGVGLDISLTGLAYQQINTRLRSAGIDLEWPDPPLPDDPVHFNLKNPPYSGCAAQ